MSVRDIRRLLGHWNVLYKSAVKPGSLVEVKYTDAIVHKLCRVKVSHVRHSL